MIGDIKFSKLNFDHTCAYMKREYTPNTDSRKYLTELRICCNKITPFVSYYSRLIDSYNKTAYNILQMRSDHYYPRYVDKNMELSPH